MERRQLLLQLEKLNTRLQNTRIQKIDGTLEDDDFQIVKKQTNDQTDKLEKQLGKLSGKHTEIGGLLETALKQLSGLD